MICGSGHSRTAQLSRGTHKYLVPASGAAPERVVFVAWQRIELRWTQNSASPGRVGPP